MAKAKTQYQVRHNDQLVDKRTSTSARIYTHAVIYLPSEKYARRMADDERHDRANHKYAVEQVANNSFYKWETEENKQAQRDRAAMTEDAYAAQEKALDHLRLDQMKDAGHFETWKLSCYCGRRDLADKSLGSLLKQGYVKTAIIVPVTRIK